MTDDQLGPPESQQPGLHAPPPTPVIDKPKPMGLLGLLSRIRWWGWVIIGVIALAAFPFLLLAAPLVCIFAAVVLVSAIVTLVSKKPTWLGLASRKSATVTLIVSLVVILVIGGLSAAVYASIGNSEIASTLGTTSASPENPAASPVKTATSTPEATTAPPTPTVSPAVAAQPGTALALLETIPVKGRAPKTGYTRDQFGPAWEDVDHNGCDTRNDILARDLTAITKNGSCTVLSGILVDPYTAKTIDFVRGQGTSTKVQIDHVVALGDAWQKGAQQLSADQRLHLANEPMNLLAVDGPTNEQKGDGDAATWLPPNKTYRCQYVARQVSVKAAYKLWVTKAEHDAIARVLSTCPDQPALSAQATAPTPAPAPAQPAPAQPAPAPAQPAPVPPAQDVYYPNCAAVRAAGKAPLHRGDPGYRSGLDRDGDGVACEK